MPLDVPPRGMDAATFQSLLADCQAKYPVDVNCWGSCRQAIFTNWGKTGKASNHWGTESRCVQATGTYMKGTVNNDFPYSSPGMTIPGYKPQLGKNQFDPNTRRIIILLIAGLLLVAAVVSFRFR